MRTDDEIWHLPKDQLTLEERHRVNQRLRKSGITVFDHEVDEYIKGKEDAEDQP